MPAISAWQSCWQFMIRLFVQCSVKSEESHRLQLTVSWFEIWEAQSIWGSRLIDNNKSIFYWGEGLIVAYFTVFIYIHTSRLESFINRQKVSFLISVNGRNWNQLVQNCEISRNKQSAGAGWMNGENWWLVDSLLSRICDQWSVQRPGQDLCKLLKLSQIRPIWARADTLSGPGVKTFKV